MKILSRIKDKLLKFMPTQPVASVPFQNPNMSPIGNFPTRGCRSPTHRVSIVPMEVRRNRGSESFSAQEPSSPKVSCMGEVKGRKKRKVRGQKRVPTEEGDAVACSEKKKSLQWIFKGISVEGRKQSKKGSVLEEKAAASTEGYPSLGAMKSFASGTGSLPRFEVIMER
ncbi:hypothetical protein PHAVU_003G267350 [Phaseolus vulgaris]|uniref:uncharacterized protein At1g76070-like n=1 Tax=Phaseolus vulgaris TaxID=3885 RepID=UPI0035CAE539